MNFCGAPRKQIKEKARKAGGRGEEKARKGQKEEKEEKEGGGGGLVVYGAKIDFCAGIIILAIMTPGNFIGFLIPGEFIA